MFYRLKNNKVVESFNKLPKFHLDLMATIIESDIPPQDDEVWGGSEWIPEFTEAELLIKAQETKTVEIEKHAKGLITTAYSNPVQGTIIDPAIQKEKIRLRRDAKVDKLTGEIVLTQADKDEAKLDQKLSEHEIKIWIDYNKAIENMLKLSTSTEVGGFIVLDETWTVWSPPV